MDDINLEIDEFNLEDLIVLGDDKKIPIIITFPRDDGEVVKAKTLVKQLTMKELGDLKVDTDDLFRMQLLVLEKALFKTDGSRFSEEELMVLPIGVVNAVSNKILEISGVDFANNRIGNF